MLRENWGSRLGFVLAASGSAVGLGNLWRFPYVSYENGGGGFVLIYLIAVLMIGLPIMIGEILIGKHAQVSPVEAFKKLGGGYWKLIGYLGVVAGTVILSYYTVIASWSLYSFYLCTSFSLNSYAPGDMGDAFFSFLSKGSMQIFLTTLFSLFTGMIVVRGV